MKKLYRAIEIKEKIELLNIDLLRLKEFLDFTLENNIDERMQIVLPNVQDLKNKILQESMQQIDYINSNHDTIEKLQQISNRMNNLAENIYFNHQGGIDPSKKNEDLTLILSSTEIILCVNSIYENRVSKKNLLMNEFNNLELNLKI